MTISTIRYQKIQNIAQIDISTTEKRSQIVATRHVSGAKNYQNQNCAGALHRTLLEELSVLSQTEEEEERKGHGKAEGTGRTDKELDPPVPLDHTGGEPPHPSFIYE